MTSQLRVLVEQPTRGKRWVAVAADWPGLERGGKSEEEAIEKIARYVPRYLPVAKLDRLLGHLVRAITARSGAVRRGDVRPPGAAPPRGLGRVRRNGRTRLGGTPTRCPRWRPLPRPDR